MQKRPWNKCKCGSIITDSDEKECPEQGLENNPKHELELIELSDKELYEILKKGKVRVYTKYHSRFKGKSPP